MRAEFWLSKWAEGQTGFHGEAVHEDLLAHQARFLGEGPLRVLVPLCGKSLDLDWLAAQGHEVIGVELAPEAVAEVMARTTDEVVRDTHGPFQRCRAGRITILCGDVLSATPALLGKIDRIWDRAALVALPPDMRPRYAATLTSLLAPGGLQLQNAFSYDQSKMDGPPFSVPPSEVATLYATYEREVLDTRVLREGKFAERGVDAFETHVTLMRKPQ